MPPAHVDRRLSTRGVVWMALFALAGLSACVSDGTNVEVTIDTAVRPTNSTPTAPTLEDRLLADLAGVRWYVTTVDERSVEDLDAWFRVSTNPQDVPDGTDADVTIEGFDGCNRYVTWGLVHGKTITLVGVGVSTAVGCDVATVSFPSDADLMIVDGMLATAGPPSMIAVSAAARSD